MDLDDHFEDFTTASEWESFIARLEQVLSETMSKPVDPSNVTRNWLVVHEKISFADFPFKFSYFKRLDNPVEDGGSDVPVLSPNKESEDKECSVLADHLLPITVTGQDFPPKYSPHVVSEYFGLYEFAVLSSAALEPVEKESKLKILLSSACIAINNTNCNFPVFVQFHHWSQKYFHGIAETNGIRTSFHMVMLQPNPNLPHHLSGLLDIMKSKIGSSLQCPVGISAHFFYKICKWPSEINCDSYPPELFDILQTPPHKEWKTSVSHTSFLPFGSLDDPFMSLDLVAGWPSLTEDVVVDSATYTDLEPENAQEWYFSLIPDPNAEFRLHDLVEGIWKLKYDKRTCSVVLGRPIESGREIQQNFSSAFDKITKTQVPIPVSGIKKVLASRRKLYSTDASAFEDLAPLAKDQMDFIIDFLFPDAKNTFSYPYPDVFGENQKFTKDYLNSIMENLNGTKSAPVGSLVWRIAVIIGYLLAYGDRGSPSAVAYVWAEIILELRYRVDNCRKICGLEDGAPNIGSCLLNQKLQMLNCCVSKKIAREAKQNERGNSPVNEEGSEKEESDEEFFDCEDDDDVEDDKQVATSLSKPSGRLRKNGKLRLLKNGEPMFIPDTQDPAPLTEDVLEEQSKVMLELGEGALGSELRAKMMSASLLSDMESFKAANPGAELEDFVRWYSPRDWVETGETDKFGNTVGELSPRMKLPGNFWLEVWSTARAIPARRQKRLFDDTKEAEKVLHWLVTRTLHDISQLLFPCLIHASVMKILDEVESLPYDYEIPATISQNVISLTRCFHYVEQLDKTSADEDLQCYKNTMLKTLLRCEKDITEIRSFRLKFPDEDIHKIVGQGSSSDGDTSIFPTFIKVDNGRKSELGSRIFKLLLEPEVNEDSEIEENRQTSKFGKPFRRVFVLKYNPPSNVRDRNSAVCLPQRMGCLLKNDMFVLAGTFSTRTTSST